MLCQVFITNLIKVKDVRVWAHISHPEIPRSCCSRLVIPSQTNLPALKYQEKCVIIACVYRGKLS